MLVLQIFGALLTFAGFFAIFYMIVKEYSEDWGFIYIVFLAIIITGIICVVYGAGIQWK